jgi:hypothetical protein
MEQRTPTFQKLHTWSIMIEVEEIQQGSPTLRWQRAAWLPGILVRPGKTMRAVIAQEKGAWHIPMLLLTVLTLVMVFVAAPLRLQAAQAAPTEPPPGFEYMSPEQQQQYMDAQASNYGTTQTYVFPAVAGVAGLWLGWLVLGGLLHLILTMLGSRSTSATAFNIVAWGALPLAIRMLVQIVYMLSAHRLIAAQGLAGFLPADAQGVLGFARILLSMVDIYLIWQLLLLWLGASLSGGMTRARSFGGVLVAMLLYMVLAAVPLFAIAQISGLNTERPFFMF